MKYLKTVPFLISIIILSIAPFIRVNPLIESVPKTDSSTIVKEIKIEKKKSTNITYKDTLTPNTLYKLVKAMGAKHPEIITAQAIEESGYFKSNLYKTNGNLFGMKLAGSRPSTACGVKKGYADYKCHDDYILYSVMDRVMLDASFYRGLSKEAYYQKLARTYAANPNYVRNLKKIIQKHGNNFKS